MCQTDTHLANSCASVISPLCSINEIEEVAMAKIAVINDDPDFINLVCTVLQDEGYETVTAHKGCETVEMVRKASPDVILMDIVMESWDSGFNTVTMLRLRADTSGVPVI